MWTRFKTVLASALVALTLTGCATSGRYAAPTYPNLPADLRICFNTTVAPPSAGPMPKKRVMLLIAAFKASESEKTDCGKRLIAFYDNLGKPSGT
jgi:hypothetical protein